MSKLKLVNTIRAIESVINNCDCLDFTAEEKVKAISTIIGLHLAIQSPLPSSPVSSPKLHYVNTIADNVRRIVSEVNEVYLINLDVAIATAMNGWINRYNLLYPNTVNTRVLLSTLSNHVALTGVDLEKETYSTISKLLEEQSTQFDNLFAVLKQELAEE